MQSTCNNRFSLSTQTWEYLDIWSAYNAIEQCNRRATPALVLRMCNSELMGFAGETLEIYTAIEQCNRVLQAQHPLLHA